MLYAYFDAPNPNRHASPLSIPTIKTTRLRRGTKVDVTGICKRRKGQTIEGLRLAACILGIPVRNRIGWVQQPGSRRFTGSAIRASWEAEDSDRDVDKSGPGGMQGLVRAVIERRVLLTAARTTWIPSSSYTSGCPCVWCTRFSGSY